MEMAQSTPKLLLVSRCLLTTLLIIALITFIVIGPMGTYLYVDAHQDQKKYNTKTECLVLDESYSTQTCSTGGDYSSSYTCYNEDFKVSYTIFNTTRITSTISTKQVRSLSNVEIGQTYSCYYDRTDVKSVKWEPGKSTVGLVLMIVGWSGIVAYLLGIGIAITICVIH